MDSAIYFLYYIAPIFLMPSLLPRRPDLGTEKLVVVLPKLRRRRIVIDQLHPFLKFLDGSFRGTHIRGHQLFVVGFLRLLVVVMALYIDCWRVRFFLVLRGSVLEIAMDAS